MRYSHSSLVGRYILELRGYGQTNLILLLILMVLSALSEGIGLVLLVPLLSLLGVGGGYDGDLFASVKSLFDQVGLPLNLETLLVIYLGLVIGRLLLIKWREVLSAKFELGFIAHLRARLWRHIVSARWSFLRKQRASDFNHVLMGETLRISRGLYEGLQVVALTCLLVTYGAVAFKLSAGLSLSVIVGGITVLLLLKTVRRKIGIQGERFTFSQRELFGVSSELMDGMKQAKSNGVERDYIRAFDSWNEDILESRMANQHYISWTSFFLQASAAIAIVLLAWGNQKVGAVSIVELLVLITVFARLAPFIVRIERALNTIADMLPAFQSFCQMEQLCEQEVQGVVENEDDIHFDNKIELKSVSLFSEDNQPVLQDITLVLHKHDVLGLSGASGSGKTTIADVLTGLIEPDQGTVLIDETPLTAASAHSWKSHIAYVPQEPFLIFETLRANLLWGNSTVDDTALFDVLRKVNADTFVRDLPNGLDTVVGDLGGRLSQGEKQRIALARALLKKPNLLILDEVTSALDADNQNEICSLLSDLKGQVTLVIISHSASLLTLCDQLCVVEDGRIVKHGPYSKVFDK